MNLILAITLAAQSLWPLSGYLTADQIDPGRAVLATDHGRYQIFLDGYCEAVGVGVGSNVAVLGPAGSALTTYGISLQPADPSAACLVDINKQISTTPCFAGDDGICDVALESD